MGNNICPACVARLRRLEPTVPHTHVPGSCIVLSKAQLEERERDRMRYLDECERTGQHPDFDTVEEWRGDK